MVITGESAIRNVTALALTVIILLFVHTTHVRFFLSVPAYRHLNSEHLMGLQIEMDVFQRYYKINEILMSCIGQWPYQSRLARIFFFTLALIVLASQCVSITICAVKLGHDPEAFIECIPPLLFFLIVLAKLVTCTINSSKLWLMLDIMSKNWKVWTDDREIALLHEYSTTGRKVAVAWTVAVFSTGVVFLGQPVVPKIIDVLLHNGTEPGEFPFPVYYYRLDQQKYYFYIIGYTYMCITMIILINVAGDTMFIVHVHHCCGIFAALGFAKLIEATYSGCFFFVVGLNMIIMSVTALQIITRSTEPKDTIRFIVFVGAQMIHLFIDSYVSQTLIDHSNGIFGYIQNGKWYETSLKSQQLMKLMMMRSMTPCRVTAGKICVMSIRTFGTVVRTSISYFTLLRSMQ